MFQYNCEVFYEDTDMGGRVYHANYLKFTERARSKFIESLHLDQRAMPAYFGDKLVIRTTLIEIKRASMMLRQEILKDNKRIFDCDVRLALLNSSGKPEKFSVDFVYKIEKFFKFSQKKIGE